MAEPNELKTFQDLYEELSKPEGQGPEYVLFLNALDSVNKKMTAMYTADRYGRIPLVTEEDRQELIKLHEDLGEAAEKALLKSELMQKPVLDTLKKLNGLNNMYRSAMRGYDPKEKKALHTIHEEMRTPVIDTRDSTLKAQVGGSVSKRQPLTFLDSRGREITGVFIPEKYEDGAEKIANALIKISEKCPGDNGKQLFRGMLEHFKNWLPEDVDPNEIMNVVNLLGECLKVPGSNPAEFTPKSINDYIARNMRNELGGSVQNQIGADALIALADVLNDTYHGMMMNRDDAKIEAGGRIDTRNAAMSSVAELLGVPNVIARAKPMQIIDAKGNKVNGTFMTEAEGMDPNHLPPEAEKVSLASASKTDGKAFKSVADMQILDYICGNIDRHPANFFMKFDKKGKLLDVQGIDNDCSCGTVVPVLGEGSNRMVGLKDLMVISESMAQKINSLTPAQLKFSLRGYGLSEKELKAACERLKHVRSMVQQKGVEYTPNKKPVRGKLLIVPDNEFKNLKLEELATYKTVNINGQKVQWNANLFSMVKDNLEDFPDLRREQEQERIANNEALHTLKSEIAIGSDNRANPGAIVKNAEQAEKLHKEMDKRTNPWKLFWKSSPAYEKMEKATQDYFKFQRQVRERLELAKDPVYTGKSKNAARHDFDREAVVTQDDMDKMRELAKKMYEAANAYCEGKKDLNLATASPYQKTRLEIGQTARDFAKKAMAAVTEKEQKTLDENEKLAQENKARTEGNKREAEDRQKNGPMP